MAVFNTTENSSTPEELSQAAKDRFITELGATKLGDTSAVFTGVDKSTLENDDNFSVKESDGSIKEISYSNLKNELSDDITNSKADKINPTFTGEITADANTLDGDTLKALSVDFEKLSNQAIEGIKSEVANPSGYIPKGDISVAADFPTSTEVQIGWQYSVKANVTDNDATKTNTGDSFLSGESIVWKDGGGWMNLGSSYVTQAQKDKIDLGANFVKHIDLTTPAITPFEGAVVTPNEDGVYVNYGGLEKSNDACDFVYESGNWVKKQTIDIDYSLNKKEAEINGVEYINGGYINTTNGGITPSATRKYTDYKNIANSDKIILRGFTNGTSVALVAFYDENKVFISALTSPSLVRHEIEKFTFPVGAVYIRVTGAGDDEDYLIYSTIDSTNKRIEQSEANIEANIDTIEERVELIKEKQFIEINDTPTDVFNLSDVRTSATTTGRFGFGNKVVPASNHVVNLFRFIPNNLISDYNGYALCEIYSVTDDLLLFSKQIPQFIWNASFGELFTLALDSNITLESGKEYQVRYAIIDNDLQLPVNYYRVVKVNDEVPSRVMYDGDWDNIIGDYNCYMEVLFSTDYSVLNKLVIETSQVLDLEAYVDSKVSEAIQSDIELFLPSEVCCAVGQTIELYTEQLIDAGNKNNYHIDYSCSIGQHKKRKFTVTGTTVGTYSLTVYVRDNSLNTIISKTIDLKIVDETVIPEYKMLCIGASYTNNKIWYDTWKDLVFGKTGNRDSIVFVGSIVGTWGNHEGRSGWTAGRYLTGTTDEASNVELTVSGVVEEPAIKKAYNVPLSAGGTTTFEVEELNLVGGTGTMLMTRTGADGLIDATGTITEVESGTAGDASINYSARVYVSENPFWNDTTQAIDFINYQNVYGVPTPDGVQFLIGTNSLSGGESGIDQANSDLKQLIDYVIRDWGTGVEIYVCFIPYLSDQNGLGKTYGAGSFGNKEDLDHLVFYMISTLHELLQGYSNVYFTPIAQCHDSQYNFGKVEIDVNPRNSQYTEFDPVEGVHPQTEGYNQFADVMFATWLNNR